MLTYDPPGHSFGEEVTMRALYEPYAPAAGAM